MIRYIYLFGSVFACLLLLHAGCTTETKHEMSQEEQIEWGKYLVELGGCNDCHTPKTFSQTGMAFDTTKTLSGHPANFPIAPIDTSMIKPGNWYLAGAHLSSWVGPWGISFAANLTPDDATGIGTWTDEIFIKALRTGKHMGTGRPILPPMPWESIGKLKDEDLKSIFAYLKSLPPVRNQVPEPMPPNMIGKNLTGK
jgi:hypothetical protein